MTIYSVIGFSEETNVSQERHCETVKKNNHYLPQLIKSSLRCRIGAAFPSINSDYKAGKYPRQDVGPWLDRRSISYPQVI